jgi:uncharacterized protein YunC (DUF1805 family)
VSRSLNFELHQIEKIRAAADEFRFIPKSTEENMINCAEMTRGIVVSARIPPALLASVEEAAARLGLNRGQFVREAIQMAIRAENAA